MPEYHEGLTHLGSHEHYKFDKPAPEILEAFPNPGEGSKNPYSVIFDCQEFTSRCPKTGQPDYGRIIIDYCPAKICLESKSLKLYLVSYREFGGFMEKICNMIYEDLENFLNPIELTVTTAFVARGGITTKVIRSSL